MIAFTLKDRVKTRLLIAESGNSLRGFAKEIQVSHCYLSQILSGKGNPSPCVAQRIAENLHLKVEDIFLIDLVDKSTKSSEIV
jgi:transcriptional regulator with XRE-family HTH domain